MARVTRLRHVDVAVPDFERMVDFYGGVYGLKRIDGDKGIAFFRAEGSPEQFVYRIRKAEEKRVDLIGWGADSPEDVDQLAAGLAAAGVRFVSEPGELQTPGGGYGFRCFDPDGWVLEISSGVDPGPVREIALREGIPVALSHMALATPNRKAMQEFYAEQLGFKFSDWNSFMGFYRCNPTHHSIAFADADVAALNHVAFATRSIDDMMRASGRLMKDGRAAPFMGPGRFDAGDNAFYYFLDPQGEIREYNAEMEQIVDDDAWTPSEHSPTERWGTAQRPEGTPVFTAAGRSVAPPV